MLISLTAFMGLKPAASYFKRDFCTANLHQKVLKKFEPLEQKKSSRTIFLTVWEKLFVEITGKVGFFTQKYNKCRICIVDKFGIFLAKYDQTVYIKGKSDQKYTIGACY